jgi:hypothetical protein
MKILGLMFVGLLGLNASTASAQDWRVFAESGKGTIFYYDNISIRVSSERTVMVWTKQDESENSSASESYSLKRFRLDCRNETVVLLYWGEYDDKGVVIDSNTLTTYEQKSSPVVPGSIGMSLYEAICPRVLEPR